MTTIYVIIGQIENDIDGAYVVVKAFYDESEAEELALQLDSDSDVKDQYDVRNEFDTFIVNEVELD